MNISDALAELGHLLTLGPVVLNDDGAARIIFDGSLEVDFVADAAEEGGLFLDGKVCSVGPDVASLFLKQLLHAHFLGQGTGGGTFSLTAGDTEVHLGRRLFVTPMEFTEFSNHVESFVNYLEAWRKLTANGEIAVVGLADATA